LADGVRPVTDRPVTDGPVADCLVTELESRAPTLASARLLAIDGPAGSGKTTVARAVVESLVDKGVQAVLLSLDDLYDGWDGLEPGLFSRIIDQVITPLAQSRPARWQAFDWAAGAFGRWHVLAPPQVLVLEGCGSGARALAPYITLLVWLETAPEAAQARIVERDGPEVLDHLLGWRRAEQTHYEANRTRERADVVVAT
jgi:hypothetical protein